MMETPTEATRNHAKRRRFAFTPESVTMAVCALLAVGLILYPLARLLWASFFADVRFGDESYFTLENYRFLVENAPLRSALVVTFVLSIAATLISVVVGSALAWAVTRTNMPWGSGLEPLNIVPFFLSPYVGAISWTALAAPNVGILNKFLMPIFGLTQPFFNVYSIPGMIWIMSLFYIPSVYIFVVGSFRNMDPALEEAARMSGASNWRVVRHITFPLVIPAVLSGGLLALVTSAGSPDVPLALGKPVGLDTLATLIFDNRQNYPPLYNLSAAMGTILLAIALAGVYVQRAIIKPRSYVTITGRGYRTGVVDLGRWRYVALGFNVLYLLAALAVPILSLLLMSLSKYWSGTFNPQLFTVANYSYVLFDFPVTKVALQNSLILAVVGATLSVALCVVLSYTIYRGRTFGRGALDFVVMLPMAVPAIVMAMALLLVWVRTPLYGTLLILLVAYVTRYMPVAQRNISAALLSVSPDLEESARLSGASWFRTILYIVVPLLKPGIAAAWLLLFIIFIRELGVSVLLCGAGTEVMSVALYRLSNEPVAVAAFAMVQMALLLVATLLFRRFMGTSDIAM